jgi:Ca-activated chloride channel family protein
MRAIPHASLLMLLALSPAAAEAPGVDRIGGTIVAQSDGGTLHLPSLRTEYDAEVRGDIASVSVTQRFLNPGTKPLNATYQFPLPDDAAVNGMRMEIGEEVIEAVIRKKDEARQTFETAKREGRNAALLTQHRPNVFTQEVANLMPGQAVTVKLRYVQAVPRVDGAYEFAMPLVVGPRYESRRKEDGAKPIEARVHDDLQPPQAPRPAVEEKVSGQWSFGAMPAYPTEAVTGLTLPSTIDADRVGIRINLAAGMPIAAIGSRTHPIAQEASGQDEAVIRLAEGRTLDNRDFVLRYTLAGARTQAALLTRRDERGGTFSLLLEPPAMPEADDIAPRELVFLLDCSGSMNGLPIEASKAFMFAALQRLRTKDSFRIIRFSDHATQFSEIPLPATPANIRAGAAFIRTLNGEGGTEMSAGIRQALAAPPVPGLRRIVVFLTDGYIGDEAEVLNLIGNTIGDARLYAFGVGTGVNRYLLNEIGRVGAGFTRYMDPTERTEEVVSELVKRIDAPVLTDISIDWGGLAVEDVTPERVPDLFGGDSLRIMGRFKQAKAGRITVRGRVHGRPAELPVDISFEEDTTNGEALPVMWARAQIARHMAALVTPIRLRRWGMSDSDLQAKVTKLGLDHALMTQWTSFVAVAQHVVNTDKVAADLPVPLPQVAGVQPSAYGLTSAPSPAALPNSGGGMPEPETLVGFAAVAALGWFLRRRWGSHAAKPAQG